MQTVLRVPPGEKWPFDGRHVDVYMLGDELVWIYGEWLLRPLGYVLAIR